MNYCNYRSEVYPGSVKKAMRVLHAYNSASSRYSDLNRLVAMLQGTNNRRCKMLASFLKYLQTRDQVSSSQDISEIYVEKKSYRKKIRFKHRFCHIKRAAFFRYVAKVNVS